MLRFTKNLTQEHVANAIGINNATLGRYERDKIEKPKLITLQKLAYFYGVPLEEITGNNVAPHV